MYQILTTLITILLCGFAAASQGFAPENALAGQNIARRQDITTTDLQPFSSTIIYSFYSYTPVPQTSTTSFDSSMVTTTTVVTVFASDQFHALQSLLTAGASVQSAADSSAAQATELPASPSASTTDTCTDSLIAGTATSTTSAPGSASSTLPSTPPTATVTATATQTPLSDATLLSTLSWVEQYVALLCAAILANH